MKHDHQELWTCQHDVLLWQGIREFGTRWRAISVAYFPERTSSSLRNRWQRLRARIKKQHRSLGVSLQELPRAPPPVPRSLAPPWMNSTHSMITTAILRRMRKRNTTQSWASFRPLYADAAFPML